MNFDDFEAANCTDDSPTPLYFLVFWGLCPNYALMTV